MNFYPSSRYCFPLFFLFLVAPVVSSEKRYVSVLVQSSEEIATPEDGYFQTDEYWSLNLSNATDPAPPYTAWDPKPETLPTFGTLPNNRLEAQTKTALLFNRRCYRLLLQKRYADRISGFWSASERKQFEDFGLFGVKDSSRRFALEAEILPEFDLLKYFEGNSEFLSKLTVLDLSYLRLNELCYKGLGEIKTLEKLSLPLQGGVLNDAKFVSNPGVSELVVWNTTFTREGLAKLAEFKGLKRLVLNGCSLSFPSPFECENPITAGFDDPLFLLRKQIEGLTLISCDGGLIQLVGIRPWEKVSHLKGDVFPGHWSEIYPALKFISVYVDLSEMKSFTEGFGSPYHSFARWCSPNPPIFRWSK